MVHLLERFEIFSSAAIRINPGKIESLSIARWSQAISETSQDYVEVYIAILILTKYTR